MIFPKNRLRELDFLRGIAIILVILQHQPIYEFSTRFGWIGVDLFFVLSGFLVSGLLFKEYEKYGNIKPKRFLIRRGFKIYPIYYIFYIVYLIPPNKFDLSGILSDLTFTQNYFYGLGYAYAASWSLAVEEHFYFALVFFLWISRNNLGRIYKPILSIMLLCLILRICDHPSENSFTMTHLRIDSLLAGVIVSYLYNFKIEYLKYYFTKYKKLFIVIAFLCISWLPFLHELPFFTRTFGLTLLYICFGITLTYFLLTPDINNKLNKIFSKHIINWVSKIGFCSYSIYIIHLAIIHGWEHFRLTHHIFYKNKSMLPNPFFSFSLVLLICVLTGMAMTYGVENYFLKIRDRFYPSRATIQKKLVF